MEEDPDGKLPLAPDPSHDPLPLHMSTQPFKPPYRFGFLNISMLTTSPRFPLTLVCKL